MFVCKSKRLANYLIEHGSEIKRIDCDKNSKGFLVFLFKKNELLNINLSNWEKDCKTYLF